MSGLIIISYFIIFQVLTLLCDISDQAFQIPVSDHGKFHVFHRKLRVIVSLPILIILLCIIYCIYRMMLVSFIKYVVLVYT